MNYCSQCGSQDISEKIPQGDNRLRWVCASCGEVYYHNPKIVAGCLLHWEDKVLLAKRAIEPRYGYWTLPAGFMELGESVSEAAARESWEEALAKPNDMQLYGLISLPYIGQVYVIYRAGLCDGIHDVGEESLETRLFTEQEIPWNEIAFPIVHVSLKRFFTQVKENRFTVFEHVIESRPKWRQINPEE